MDGSFDGIPRSLAQLRWALGEDKARYTRKRGALSFVVTYLKHPGFSYTVWMRLAGLLQRRRRRLLHGAAKVVLLYLRHRWHIAIPEHTKVGPGLKIVRWQTIMVHHDSVIGSNVTLSPYTVLGYMNRGEREGSPVLGNGVTLLDGAKVIGAVHVGDGATIGYNSLATKDVAPGAVLLGVPAKPLAEGEPALI